MAYVEVDITFCKGCGLCVDICPKDIMALNMEIISQKGYHPAHCIDQDACIGCASCALMCPDVAIKITK
jgi:2-oxoglutarate ferredoxin oxidoreductase subunit delta